MKSTTFWQGNQTNGSNESYRLLNRSGSVNSTLLVTNETFPNRTELANLIFISHTMVKAVQFGLVFVGVILNATVIYVMIRSCQVFKSISSFLIFHLSVTQFVFIAIFQLLLFIPFNFGLNPLRFCRQHVFLENSSAAAIFSTLMAIAWDRHRNIYQPFKSLAPKTARSYFLLVTAIWAYATATSAAFIPSVQLKPVEICRKEVNSSTIQCVEHDLCDLPHNWKTQASQTVYFATGFVIPLFYMAAAYSRITFYLWKRSKNKTIHGAVVKSKVKSIRLLVLVVLAFVLCWGPKFFLDLLLRYRALGHLSLKSEFLLRMWMVWGQAFSSCINTAVYLVFSPEFKTNCYKFCCCCWCKVTSCVPHCTSYKQNKVCPCRPYSRSAELQTRDITPHASSNVILGSQAFRPQTQRPVNEFAQETRI